MAFPTAAHLKVTQTFHWTAANAYSRNLFYYRLLDGAAPDVGEMPAVADFFQDEFATMFGGVMPIGVNMSQTEVVWKAGTQQFDAVAGGVVVAGSIAGEILPEEDCVVVQKRTGNAGRNMRGRWFFSFVPEASQSAGELTAGAITDWKEICQSLRVTRVSADDNRSWEPVLVDSKNGAFVPIIDCRVVNQICNRRQRRNPKRLMVSAAPF